LRCLPNACEIAFHFDRSRAEIGHDIEVVKKYCKVSIVLKVALL